MNTNNNTPTTFEWENALQYPLLNPMKVNHITENTVLLTTKGDSKGIWVPKDHVSTWGGADIIVGGTIERMTALMGRKHNLQFLTYTRIFDTHDAFLQREDKTLNGISRQFYEALCEAYPLTPALHFSMYDMFYSNLGNQGCWNCFNIKDCTDSYECVSSTYLIRCVRVHQSSNNTDCHSGMQIHNCYHAYSCNATSDVIKMAMIFNTHPSELNAEDIADTREFYEGLIDGLPYSTVFDLLDNGCIGPYHGTHTYKPWAWVADTYDVGTWDDNYSPEFRPFHTLNAQAQPVPLEYVGA